MASHPSEPVLLSASNLEFLNTTDGTNHVEEFVASQARYAKSRVNEGRAIRASWDISTPEKEKMRLHRDKPSAGFETPVLKPRVAHTQVEVEARRKPTSPPRPKAPQSPKRDKKVKAISVFVEAVSPKRSKRQNNKSAERQERAPRSSRKRCHPRSDTTDEEHRARLADRRERKREKREIMNPREATKPSTTTRKERKEKENATSGPTNKKQKIPAGFALMHGFSSANVGKSRITVQPPLNFGVFNKGRASEKVKVDERKKDKGGFPSRIFSEHRFLNPRPAKYSAKHASGSRHSETTSSKSANHESSSVIKLKRSSAVQLRKTPIRIKGTISRRQPSVHTRCDDKEMGSSARSKTEAELTQLAKPGKSRSSVQSGSWVIEKDGCSLPSTTSEIAIVSVKSKTETAFLDVRNARWGNVLKDYLLDTKALSPLRTSSKDPQAPTATILPTTMTREITSKAPPDIDKPATTIGPWESASQVARSVLQQPQEPIFTFSKFFPLPQPEVDKSGSGEHTTHLTHPEMSKAIGSAHSDSDAISGLDELLVVHRSASLDCRGEGQFPGVTVLSALANTSSADVTPAFHAERTSVLQASSLDTVDRALLVLDAPEAANLPYRPSRIRRRPIPQQAFNPTPDDMELYQYGLEPIESDYPLPILLPDGSEEFEGTTGPPNNAETPGTLGNTQHRSLDFHGEYQAGELETYGEEVLGCYEDHPSTVFNSPHDMMYTLPSSPHERQDAAVSFTNEGDTCHEIAMDSMSGASADFSAQPEDDDDDTRTNIHLWDDAAAWPRRELTNVQRVEQDVAKKLKGHWFPHKF